MHGSRVRAFGMCAALPLCTLCSSQVQYHSSDQRGRCAKRSSLQWRRTELWGWSLWTLAADTHTHTHTHNHNYTQTHTHNQNDTHTQSERHTHVCVCV